MFHRGLLWRFSNSSRGRCSAGGLFYHCLNVSCIGVRCYSDLGTAWPSPRSSGSAPSFHRHRHIDVSAGAIFGISGVAGASAASAGLGTGAALVGAVLTGAALGALNAVLVTVLQLPSIIATLGTSSLFAGGLIFLTSGGLWIVNLPPVSPGSVRDDFWGSASRSSSPSPCCCWRRCCSIRPRPDGGSSRSAPTPKPPGWPGSTPS